MFHLFETRKGGKKHLECTSTKPVRFKCQIIFLSQNSHVKYLVSYRLELCRIFRINWFFELEVLRFIFHCRKFAKMTGAFDAKAWSLKRQKVIHFSQDSACATQKFIMSNTKEMI